ncbi:MAG: DUF4352 domain-containing protein [Anaerolineae bacterium]|nr:DUF4352 domain-containing protein [Anaerolineae bacterium]
MSQYYPQSGPYYPPENNPEDDYIYDEDDYEVEEDGGRSGDSLLQRVLIFLAGGCLVFLCIGCCGLVLTGLFALDPTALLAPTPIPGSDLGLTFGEAAFPDESVVSENKVKLSIVDVNHNAALPAVPPVEGRELIIVTVELVNLGDVETDFNERDFLLLNSFEEAYQPQAGDVVDGALGRGSLPPGEGLEGRLAFEIIAGERDLVLTWDDGSGARYIFLE